MRRRVPIAPASLGLLAALALAACGGNKHFTPVNYTIGGTVSGLTESGLVLLDNGGDALAVPKGATTFTFATPVLSSGSYAVTVQTQPPDEACTVTGGVGTASSDVTSVSVTCLAHTYTVGGTVSGLTAAGLVLLDNGADPLSVAANATSFTFATPLQDGSNYAVTVQSQPQGESCSVSGGSGTSSASVTNVVVSCHALSVTIGGRISGLSASGLVLTDNGADALSVAANATSFTFPTALATGSNYAVAIKTQPLGETCTLANGSGTAGANVTSVVVSCGATPTYTVAGSVSGFTALSGLVLLDNGRDALTIPVNATHFTFATALAAGSTYKVTVQDPGPIGENCTVTNGSGTLNANVTNVSVSCVSQFAASATNVASISVAPGPAAPANQTFNIPLVTVTVCDASKHCAAISNVLVDTATSGLRLLASVATKAGLTLPATDPPTSGAPGGPRGDKEAPAGATGSLIYECMPYAGGEAWGAVSAATVTIGKETTNQPVAVQVLDDSGAARPAFCAAGPNMSSVNALDANGVLGIGVFVEDCGSACNSASNSVYYACSAPGVCTSTAMTTGQVSNPVASFPKDNNGVIVQLPAIAAAGAAGASGYLAFGIGTQSNNALAPQATLLTAQANGDIITVFQGHSLASSLFDSAANRLYFPNSTNPALPSCTAHPGYYCPDNPPSAPLTLSATNQGSNGATSSVDFNVVNLDAIGGGLYALPDVAGPTAAGAFEWGLPFFYGRTLYIAIAGGHPGGTDGAYAY